MPGKDCEDSYSSQHKTEIKDESKMETETDTENTEIVEKSDRSQTVQRTLADDFSEAGNIEENEEQMSVQDQDVEVPKVTSDELHESSGEQSVNVDHSSNDMQNPSQQISMELGSGDNVQNSQLQNPDQSSGVPNPSSETPVPNDTNSVIKDGDAGESLNTVLPSSASQDAMDGVNKEVEESTRHADMDVLKEIDSFVEDYGGSVLSVDCGKLAINGDEVEGEMSPVGSLPGMQSKPKKKRRHRCTVY